MLDGVLVGPRLDEHPVLEEQIRPAEDVLTLVDHERDVMEPSQGATPVVGVDHVIALVGEGRPDRGDRPTVELDLLGGEGTQDRHHEVAGGLDIGREEVDMVETTHSDPVIGPTLRLVLEGGRNRIRRRVYRSDSK